MNALTLHRGPYQMLGRACLRVEWAAGDELALDVENDRGYCRISLSPKQIDRLVSFLLAPYVVSPAHPAREKGQPIGKGKG